MKRTDRPKTSCTCIICQNKLPFDIPDQLYETFLKGDIVLFAGAGISTENRSVFPYTLYEEVCGDIKIKPSEGSSFPKVMDKFCNQPNGRSMLLQKIRNRFSYIWSFSELYLSATAFHQELSTLYPIDTIVTTNWDDYFEKKCGAIPFVTAEDFAFWSMPGRKVFKIHGSVNSYGSLVLTSQDYSSCYRKLSSGIMGSYLKLILATKTIIYVGFSFNDEDFLRIHKLLSKEMGELLPHSYIVTLDKDSDARFRKQGLTPIYTDGTYFLSVIKHCLVQQGAMPPDDRYELIQYLLFKVQTEHEKFSKYSKLRKHPDDVYSLCYQDGLLHALNRIISLQNTGYYSHLCNVRNTIRSYKQFAKENRKAGKYDDLAYIEGYINGVFAMLIDHKDEMESLYLELMPLYYIYGCHENVVTLSQYKKIMRNSGILHKKAHKFAEQLVQKHIGDTNLTFQHTPFLL